MNERLKKYAPLAGYPIFYFVCFVVFSVVTFPFEKVRDRIVFAINEEQRKSGSSQQIKIEELTSSWITGIKLKGVRVIFAPTDPTQPPPELHLDEAKVRIAILPLIIGHQNISFSAVIGTGEIEGEFSMGGKDRAIDLSFDAVDAAAIAPISQGLGLPIEGHINGKVKLEFPEGRASKANGSIALDFVDFAIGDGKAKLKGQLALPKVNVGTLNVSAEAKDGLVKLSKLAAAGKDVELSGDGKIQLKDNVGDSMVDTNLKFKITDAYKGKSDITKSLFGAPGSPSGGLFELADPKVKAAKRPDGSFGFHARGSLARPDFEAAPNAK